MAGGDRRNEVRDLAAYHRRERRDIAAEVPIDDHAQRLQADLLELVRKLDLEEQQLVLERTLDVAQAGAPRGDPAAQVRRPLVRRDRAAPGSIARRLPHAARARDGSAHARNAGRRRRRGRLAAGSELPALCHWRLSRRSVPRRRSRAAPARRRRVGGAVGRDPWRGSDRSPRRAARGRLAVARAADRGPPRPARPASRRETPDGRSRADGARRRARRGPSGRPPLAPSSCSGAMPPIVPSTSPVRVSDSVVSPCRRARPKSRMRSSRSRVHIRFASLRSRWTTPSRCTSASALASGTPMRSTGDRAGTRPAGSAFDSVTPSTYSMVRNRSSFDLLERVELHDVGMVEAANHLGFALEAGELFDVRFALGWEELERDRAHRRPAGARRRRSPCRRGRSRPGSRSRRDGGRAAAGAGSRADRRPPRTWRCAQRSSVRRATG